MKRVSLLFLMMLAAAGGFAQGIQFVQLDYEAALARARAEKKNIFVDIYTSWCGPCKQMEREVYPLKEVGDYFNAHFINLKLDAEKQADHGLFKHFKPQGYPTYYWITAEGELMDVQVGARRGPAFIALAENAAKSDLNQRKARLEARWKSGERNLKLVYDYVYGILGRLDPDKIKPSVESYLATLTTEQIRQPENSKLIAGFISREWHGAMFHYIIDNAAAHEKNIGYQQFNTMMYRMVIRTGNAALVRKNDSAYRQHIATMTAAPLPHKEMYMWILEAERLLHTGEYNAGLARMTAIAAAYGRENPYLYKEFCYSLISSKAVIEGKYKKREAAALIKLAAAAFELTPSQESVTFLSAMYAKAGDYKKAYEIAATMQFHPKPVLSGMLFGKFLGVKPVVVTGLADMPGKQAMKDLLEETPAAVR